MKLHCVYNEILPSIYNEILPSIYNEILPSIYNEIQKDAHLYYETYPKYC